MSYSAIDQLTGDALFGGRVRACCVEQADTFRDDARPDFVAAADSVLRGEAECVSTFIRITASAPGVADLADDGAGGVEQSQVPDAEILSVVQAEWEVVAGLYFDADGMPVHT